MNRSNRLTIRLNDAELKKLNDNSASSGLTISGYIRHIISKSKPPTHKFDKAAVSEISRIGNNLNQITRHLNSDGAVNSFILKKIVALLNDLQNLIQGLKCW